MRMSHQFVQYILLVIIIITARPAYAYIDPGTGSLIIQSILAAIAGSIIAVKFYWYKIVAFLKSKRSDTKDQDNDPDQNKTT